MIARPFSTIFRLLLALVWATAVTGMTLPAPEHSIRVQLVARRSAVLSSEISARILEIHVREGDVFAAGDPLVTFDDALQRAQVDRAQASLFAAEHSQATQQRLLTLNSSGQIEVDLAAAELGKARAELAYAAAMLAKCRIVAPFAGRAAEQKARAQEYTQIGQPLLEIIDRDLPEIECIVPSSWLSWLQPGQVFSVRIEETGRTYPATLQRIGARVDPVSQTIKLVAIPPGEHPELMAGMSGFITALPSASNPAPSSAAGCFSDR